MRVDKTWDGTLRIGPLALKFKRGKRCFAVAYPGRWLIGWIEGDGWVCHARA